MSATWQALQLVGDALQDGRTDDAERVLAAMDADGAWDFELVRPSRSKQNLILKCLSEAVVGGLCDPAREYVPPSPRDDLVTGRAAVVDAYHYAVTSDAPQEIISRLVQWMTQAQEMLNAVTSGPDVFEMRIRSYANLIIHRPAAFIGDIA